VRLVRDVDAASMAVALAEKNAERIKLGPKASAVMQTGDTIQDSVSAAEGFESSLSSLTSKLKVLISIGDEVAKVARISFCLSTSLMAIPDPPLRQHRVEDLDFSVSGLFPDFRP
jgi:hypothetical protein